MRVSRMVSERTERISVVGLGKLGLCLASCLAEAGFETLGVDIDRSVVDDVNRGIAPWVEPGLEEILKALGGKGLTATLSHREAIDRTDITFVMVATPSEPDGRYSNRFVESALRSLATAFGESRKKSHLFVISSTVMPGSTEVSFIPLLERFSGKKLNTDFAVCYNPEFVALGNVMEGFRRPDLVVIGETMPEAGARLAAVHERLCRNRPVISRMSIVSAELAKVCLNSYITTKISFANSVANLCERIPGADVDAITRAIGADRRISPHYFQGGPGFGGACFERDNRAYDAVAKSYGVQADIIHAVEHVNRLQERSLADMVLRELEKADKKTVGILGLAFTSNTPVITASPAVKLAATLLDHGVAVAAYDPLAVENARSLFGSAIEFSFSAAHCLEKAGICVVTLRSPGLKQEVEKFVPSASLTVIDCWRMIDAGKLHERVRYIPLGRFRDA
jgi:UDPglucose 6-dehydrogenase